MSSTNFEKIANQLARVAVVGDELPAEIVQIKNAANNEITRYLLGGLGGAGIGALVGATQAKNKKRNALYYGTLGGLGGLGLAHVINSANTTNNPAAAGDTATSPQTKELQTELNKLKEQAALKSQQTPAQAFAEEAGKKLPTAVGVSAGGTGGLGLSRVANRGVDALTKRWNAHLGRKVVPGNSVGNLVAAGANRIGARRLRGAGLLKAVLSAGLPAAGAYAGAKVSDTLTDK